MSKKLMNMLSEFIVCELGAKVIQGVTYSMFIADRKKDVDLFNHYSVIKDEAVQCGYNSNEVIRTYEVGNGFIVDVDLLYAKEVLLEVSKAAAVANGEEEYGDRIGDKPEERRQRDFRHLAKFLKASFDMGKLQVEVVLFNKTPTNRIADMGIGPRDEKLIIRYNAYALRPDDIELINEYYLMPAGFRVASIRACEILPQKKGCTFEFSMEHI